MASYLKINEFALAKAIEGKVKVILHGYRSNNSDDCRDRKVEPISFAREHKQFVVMKIQADATIVQHFKNQRCGGDGGPVD